MTRNRSWWVYIIKCGDSSFYTGVTSDLKQRIMDHKGGRGGFYTKKKGVTKLVYKKKFFNKKRALQRERQIKGWRREKKIALIRNEIS